MIVFDLHCAQGHSFEGWFGSSADFEEQNARGLVTCPSCGESKVSKAPMAPAVSAKGNTKSEMPGATRRESVPSAPTQAPASAAQPTQPVANAPIPAEVHKALGELAKAQEKALKDSTWVGKDFAEQSREMHYGERDEAAIHGQASLEEAKALAEEGVPVAPLLLPIASPDEVN